MHIDRPFQSEYSTQKKTLYNNLFFSLFVFNVCHFSLLWFFVCYDMLGGYWMRVLCPQNNKHLVYFHLRHSLLATAKQNQIKPPFFELKCGSVVNSCTVSKGPGAGYQEFYTLYVHYTRLLTTMLYTIWLKFHYCFKIHT